MGIMAQNHSEMYSNLTERDQFGGMLSLQITCYDKDNCKEFTVSAPNFNFTKWLMLTALFNILGYAFELHRQDWSLMSVLIAILTIILLLKLHLKVKQESLLVMRSLGIQLTTTFSSGRTRVIFYDMQYVKDIVINEAITMQRVINYLAILLREERTSDKVSKLVPLYRHSWPSLACLRQIYRATHVLLHTKGKDS